MRSGPNNSLQRTTPAPLSGIAACNRSNGLVQVNVKSVIMLLCRAASGKPSLGLVLPLSSSVRPQEYGHTVKRIWFGLFVISMLIPTGVTFTGSASSSSTCTISGIVSKEFKESLEGIRVNLLNVGTLEKRIIKARLAATDESGFVQFSNLETGMYLVYIIEEEFQVYILDEIRCTTNAKVQLDIALEPMLSDKDPWIIL